MHLVMNQVAVRLLKDHEELEQLLRRLAQDAAGSAAELASTWNALESRLIRHMEVEERFLLPLIEAGNPAEVERTRQEHAHIRDLLVELGVGIDLHTVREHDIQQLIELLRNHAAHEDVELYRLSGDKASVAVEHSIAESLRTALRSALGGGERHRQSSADRSRP
jgi:hypothetical protein